MHITDCTHTALSPSAPIAPMAPLAPLVVVTLIDALVDIVVGWDIVLVVVCLVAYGLVLRFTL